MIDHTEIINKKYSTLKEQINKLIPKIQENKNNKDNNNFSENQEFKNFENKIKKLLINDQNNMQTFADNLILRIEERMTNFDRDVKTNNESINDYLIQIKENFEVNLIFY